MKKLNKDIEKQKELDEIMRIVPYDETEMQNSPVIPSTTKQHDYTLLNS